MEHNKRLKEALEAFSRSPRFSLFRRIQIARLMPEVSKDIKGIGELTLEELFAQVQERGGLPDYIIPQQAEALSQLLVVLGEDSASTPCVPEDDIFGVEPFRLTDDLSDTLTAIDIPTLDGQLNNGSSLDVIESSEDVLLGSVPLELALRTTLAKIVEHKRYEQVRCRTLGEFWDPERGAAPFEEAMTIEQLARLDLGVLLKKRMVSDTRIQSIVCALQLAQGYLEELERIVSDQDLREAKINGSNPARPKLNIAQTGGRLRATPNTSEPAVAVRGAEISPIQPLHQGFSELSDNKSKLVQQGRTSKENAALELSNTRAASKTSTLKVPLTGPRSLLALAVAEALRSPGLEHPLISKLGAQFSLHECLAIVSGARVSTRNLCELRRLIDQTLTQQERELVTALLRAPAVSIAQIAQVMSGIDGDISAHSLFIAAIVARGLGAVPLNYEWIASEEFWSVDPELVAGLLKRTPRATSRRASKTNVILGASSSLLDPVLLELYLKTHKKQKASSRRKAKQTQKI